MASKKQIMAKAKKLGVVFQDGGREMYQSKGGKEMQEITITEEQDIAGGVIIGAYVGDERIGMLWLTGEWEHLDGGRFVRLIEVGEGYRRKGIATKLWEYAVSNGFKPNHDSSKTDEGNLWAKTLEQEA